MGNMWPYNEDDFMEIGETGWIPIGQGSYLNKYNNHTIDECGKEYDEDGNIVYDPEISRNDGNRD
jgi:hypothetical protein